MPSPLSYSYLTPDPLANYLGSASLASVRGGRKEKRDVTTETEESSPVAVKIELPDNVDEDPVDSASEPEQDLEEMQSGDELDGSQGSESDAEVDEGEQVIQSEIQDDNGLEYFADF
ncbi:hypothetical protein JOM56_015116 [Amanita muscaria]